MTLQELIDANVAVLEKRKALSDKAAKENRSFTEDEQKEYDKLTADYGQRKDTIKRQRELDEETRSLGEARPPHPCPAPTQDDEKRRREVEAPNIIIPRATPNLRCFKGEGGAQRAEAFGHLVLASRGRIESRRWCDKHSIEVRIVGPANEKRAMGESVNTAGGIFVQDLFRPEMVRLVEERGIVRQNASFWAMNKDSGLFPKRTSGLTAFAVGENTEITASDAAAASVRLTPKKWGTLTRVASELFEDSAISIGDWIATEIAYAFADREDEAGFNGDGTSVNYHGITGAAVKIDDGTHTASVYDALASNDSALTLDLADFEGAAGSLPTFADANPKWFMSKPVFFASAQRLMDAGGGNTIDTLANGRAFQFLGYPVVFTQVLTKTTGTLASTVIILFGDFNQAVTMGVARDIQVMTDDSRYFELDQTAIRGTERFDINVHDLGDNTDAGSLIGLKTAA